MNRPIGRGDPPATRGAPGATGGGMSDQADGLREWVRARAGEIPQAGARSKSPPARLAEAPGIGPPPAAIVGLFASLFARWAPTRRGCRS
ncbi:hypothetical protein EP7_005423 [Isosphaeraceae bacterium EP7]